MEYYRDLEWLTLQPQLCITSAALTIAKNHCFNFIKTQVKPYIKSVAVLSLENVSHGDTKQRSETWLLML